MNITWNDLNRAMTMDCVDNILVCPCGGHGWMLSDYDTFHECPYHRGRIHPEVHEYATPDTKFPTLRVLGKTMRFSSLEIGREAAREYYDCGYRVTFRWETL